MYKMVKDEQMVQHISQHRWDLNAMVSALVGAANAAGGRDNISAVVISVAPAGVASAAMSGAN
jgi:serine/threonine protein phosphatase PrpC